MTTTNTICSVITVDFDDTLFEDPAYKIGNLWAASGTGAEPIKRVHDFIHKKAKEGFEIHVVTAREEKHVSECWDLIKLYNLPIKSVVAVGGMNKVPALLSLQTTLHIDDNIQVCVLAKQAGIKVLLVDWGQEDTNSTAKLFKKI
jgi:uncharacterized HAD superfamily protein